MILYSILRILAWLLIFTVTLCTLIYGGMWIVVLVTLATFLMLIGNNKPYEN